MKQEGVKWEPLKYVASWDSGTGGQGALKLMAGI